MLINKLLKIKYPVIQGAMANIATAEFAAAVSNIGGLGVIGAGAMDGEQARAEIRKCKELTDKPFGINVMLVNPYADEIMKVITEEKVAVVTTGAGNPGKYVAMLKESGAKIIPVVAGVALAIRMERLGVDGLIAEGCEAGGHIGEMTTMTLIPQIRDAVKIPVIAAGGIADSRGFVAALSLGADGVQIGTSLLVSKECPIHESYKKAVIKAKDSSTTVTGRSLNMPVRVMKNRMSRKYLQLEKEIDCKEEMERLTLGSLRRAVFEGDIDDGSVMMGQIAGLCNEERTIAEILDDIVGNGMKVMDCIGEKLGDLQ
ncbi:MAG: nitronate monooxygenase [Peptostreptococcaceae bacterium]|nr:nitronate monooxygenase [Peptostreptococcaceae bacterium]MDY5739817.1 nitronate monooxygenase [Anaerovoracaceae bacterium]